ncbi:MAG: insulinase family protein, partial [Solobacterium sp.]|nr:insulinase family protein [Solobacterium sp.]
MNINDCIHGFRIVSVREAEDIRAQLVEAQHEKTGAKLIWLKREEVNKTFAIAFRTIPEDDTGVFHILEHCVLNGSDRYPVREPFVDLLKSSMQTFLNAMTYPDKTMFPVSSRNTKDFHHLVGVYLDAVFHPLIYRNPNIFRQEGWHYEIHDPAETPVYNGVVYNEMKGAFSSVDETIISELNRMLFENCYRYVSGGDPEKIPDLSYEAFLAAHRRYYHPSNARIILDGDLDIEETLAQIASVLDEYEYSDPKT